MSYLRIGDGFPLLTAEQARQLIKAAMHHVEDPRSNTDALLTLSVYKTLYRKGLVSSLGRTFKGTLMPAWASPRGCIVVGILLLAAKLAEKEGHHEA